MHFSPSNILVTGAAGFIGSHFVNLLLKKYDECRVISYDKLTYAGNLDNLRDVIIDKRHFFVKGDVCDSSKISETLRTYHIDTIVHFAAESHVDRSIIAPSEFIQTNIVGTYCLLESAKNHWQQMNALDPHACRFHHISTDEVYGSLEKDALAFTEASTYQPNSPYSASKASSDHLVRAYYKTYGLPITASNCSNNYGPRQHREKLIPTVIRCCKQGQSIPIYGSGSNIRDWLYVEDHVQAILAIIERGQLGETYNVGGNNELSNLELVQQICAFLSEFSSRSVSYEQLISFVEDRPGHDWRYAVEIEKIKTELDWQPTTSFLSGVEQTMKFYWEQF